ncbi:unnamed protein product [Pleuronectes platessa]|uniref:Uncharacterized protein n=1 Tax=Pleuronectes platessa TaxID=8262 RepID=A0A9N7Y1P7_PLEPL|nr:unnamed protein product [Pleuronectes platessa]
MSGAQEDHRATNTGLIHQLHPAGLSQVIKGGSYSQHRSGRHQSITRRDITNPAQGGVSAKFITEAHHQSIKGNGITSPITRGIHTDTSRAQGIVIITTVPSQRTSSIKTSP